MEIKEEIEQILDEISRWDISYGWFRFYKKRKKDYYILKLSTGGWSYNEYIIEKQEIEHSILYGCLLKQWNAGGHYILEIPTEYLDKKLIKELKYLNK